MIISASRRTDIPAFFSDWFFRRMQEGFVYVRNPVNPRRVSKIKLSPDIVDGIVFWTKNPAPMLDRLPEIREYAYYFQYTITPYERDIEPNLPEKAEILETFQRLSERIGADHVIWRYDPILINPQYPREEHLRRFAEMAHVLQGFTHKVIISFLDVDYRNVQRNARMLAAEKLTAQEQLALAGELAEIARGCGMEMNACAETMDFSACGIQPAHCIDATLLETLLHSRLHVKKDKSQRTACGCAESIDIGMYNTCGHGCRYCYANYNAGEISKNQRKHDPASPLLCGMIGPMDTIYERDVQSSRDNQICF